MRDALVSFGLVFLAELGDKTQLVALGLAAKYRLRPVVAGVILAYLLTTTFSVIVGSALDGISSLTQISGVLFLGFAAFALWGRDVDAELDSALDAPASERSELLVFGSVVVMMSLGEFGDKTMLTTAALAARGDAVGVWVGSALGIATAGLGGVAVGKLLGRQLPERPVRYFSAGLFAIFGLLLLAGVG